MKATDPKKIDRASKNIHKLLADLLKDSARLENKSKALRKRILADMGSEVDSLPDEQRLYLLSAVAVRVQAIFNAAGSPKVTVSGGCVGNQGFGVRVEQGGSYAGVCVMGSLDEGITGGGVEVGTTC